MLAWVPPSLRLPIAERFLRRPEQPGPAAEHVLQYLVSSTIDRGRGADANPGAVASRPEVAPKNRVKKPVLVGQADFFYKSQYRQYATPTMGAFAMTATGVLAATSGSPTGCCFAAGDPRWRRCSRVIAIRVPRPSWFSAARRSHWPSFCRVGIRQPPLKK